MFNLYNHIESLGKKYGYQNIQQLCRAADVSRAIMTELKKGRAKSISRKTAQKFADLLGVSIDVIYGTENQADETDELSHELQLLKDRPDLRALLHVGAKNSPESVRKLADLMETMKEE